MAIAKHETRTDPAPAPQLTTDVEDIKLLAADIVALALTAPYDDMRLGDIAFAHQLAYHNLRLLISEHGTLDAVPASDPARRRR